METALRWSPKSNASEQRLLFVDVVGRSFKLCRINGYKNAKVSYDIISTQTKVPAFRAFDWCPFNESLVAVGQSSGEATVLRIGGAPQDTISLPIRNQRYCNAVAFNTEGLLAAGLDKVRNDFCLNVWDLNQRISTTSPRGVGSERPTTEPIRKLASSEPITSVKFFSDRPDQLVAGVKAQFVRIYDLRGEI
jgi:WD repeat-containing protein mio